LTARRSGCNSVRLQQYMIAKLSIVIVSWNVKDDLLRCLASLRENPPSEPFEVIVVDNMSSDGTAEAVKQEYPEVVIVANRENRGFAAANNQALAVSHGRYVLLLNPDTIVHPDSLDKLIAFMDNNPDVGVCGPKLLNDDGSIQASARRFPTFRAVLHCHTAFRLVGLFKPQYRKWRMKDFDFDRQTEVDQLIGAAMMVRRSVIDEVGGMDERFFMYYEEVDLCYRIKQAGWGVVFLPDAVITHLSGRSAKQIRLKRRLMMLKSMMAFFRKHRNRYAVAVFAVVFKCAVIARNIIHLAIGVFTYSIALLTMDRTRKKHAAEKTGKCSLLLSKYLWDIIRM